MENERIKNQERGGEERKRSDLMAGFSNVNVRLFTSAQHLFKNADLESADLEWDLGFRISSQLPGDTDALGTRVTV